MIIRRIAARLLAIPLNNSHYLQIALTNLSATPSGSFNKVGFLMNSMDLKCCTSVSCETAHGHVLPSMASKAALDNHTGAGNEKGKRWTNSSLPLLESAVFPSSLFTIVLHTGSKQD